MDKREWIEIGKMWENMRDKGIQFLHYYDISSFEEYPYKTIKDVYFTEYLGIEEFEDFTFECDEKLLDKLYEIADNQGITVDEVVINCLKDMIERGK